MMVVAEAQVIYSSTSSEPMNRVGKNISAILKFILSVGDINCIDTEYMEILNLWPFGFYLH